MENNKLYSVLINAVIANEGKILILQKRLGRKHRSENWTIPRCRVENSQNDTEVFDIIEKTLIKDIRREVGVDINNNKWFIANNTSRHSEGHIELELVFLCEYQNGTAKALEDTINLAWISPRELNNYEFPQNIKNYIAKGFSLLPYMIRHKPVSRK